MAPHNSTAARAIALWRRRVSSCVSSKGRRWARQAPAGVPGPPRQGLRGLGTGWRTRLLRALEVIVAGSFEDPLRREASGTKGEVMQKNVVDFPGVALIVT